MLGKETLRQDEVLQIKELDLIVTERNQTCMLFTFCMF